MDLQPNKLFQPKSIAVIGATNRTDAQGFMLFRNLRNSKYEGRVFALNLKHQRVQGQVVYRSVDDLPEIPDLALITTPQRSVPGLVRDCGEAGIGAVIIYTDGFREGGREGKSLLQKIQKTARKYGILLLGPSSWGLLNASIGLNATLFEGSLHVGKLAFISQGSQLDASVMDWAKSQGVGFSFFISAGDMVDVDFGICIDYLGAHPRLSSILLFMESLQHTRRFMSATRSVARNKPILVLRAGESVEAPPDASLSETGALVSRDAAYDAAFRRAGIIRVRRIADLFHCAHALETQPLPEGNRLAVITNAGSIGVLTTDHLMRHGGLGASFSRKSLQQLRHIPAFIEAQPNPVTLPPDADGTHFLQALEICLSEPTVDGILVVFVPHRQNDPREVALAISSGLQDREKPVLAAFLGADETEPAREILEESGIPHYRYPESAVDTFLYLWKYRLNKTLLQETPAVIPHRFSPDKNQAQQIIDQALKAGKESLSEREAKALLHAYQIPIPEGLLATSEAEARRIAKKLGYPLVAKLSYDQAVRKAPLGGVLLDLHSEHAVAHAYRQLTETASALEGYPPLQGIWIEPQFEKRYELLIGAKQDPVFGPILVFGMGGMAVDVFRDLNVGLPPLNMALAKRLMEETRIFQLLKGTPGQAGVDLKAIQFVLYKFAYLLMDFPEIGEIEINPFGIHEQGGMVLDAKVGIRALPAPKRPYVFEHLVISPYPDQYKKRIKLKNGKSVLLRPIQPEDEPLEVEMFHLLSRESVYFRFFGHVRQVTHEMVTRFTQIDYDREIAIVAEIREGDKVQFAGVVRLVRDVWRPRAEYAIITADPWQRQSLAAQMTDFILEIARERGLQEIYATVLKTNTGMLKIFERKGFVLKALDAQTFQASLVL